MKAKLSVFISLSLLLIAFVNSAWSQALRLPCGKTTCTTYKVDLSTQTIELRDKDDQGSRFCSIGSLEEWGRLHSKRLKFATNAGIFSKTYIPLGLYISEGKQIVALNKGEGSGNFYLKPNGVFYISKNKAYIVETSQYGSLDVTWASQSGPLLVNQGKIHPKFRQDSSNVNIRNAVGVINDSQVVFAISDGPINFYDLSTFFRDSLSCQNALYLDGAISKMYLPEIGRNQGGGDFAAMFAVYEKLQNKRVDMSVAPASP